MAAVPIYVWNGTAWQETGPVIPASPIKYQASAPSSPSTGDIWVDSDGDVTTGSQQFQRFRFVASGGETSISGVDANGATLAYTAGTEIVALNGSTLVRGQDYTATNGTSITGLSPALVANDVVEVFSFMAFNVANTYTQSQVDGLLNDYMGMRLIVPSSATNGTVGATGAVTFSGVSSVSLNGVFSSTYENYRILITFNGTAGAYLQFKFRASGTDNSSGYNYGMNMVSSAGSAFNFVGAGTTQAYISRTVNSSTVQNNVEMTVFNPYETKRKGFSGTTQYDDGATVAFGSIGGSNSSTTAHDGFSLIPSSGNISGTVRVYGHKN